MSEKSDKRKLPACPNWIGQSASFVLLLLAVVFVPGCMDSRPFEALPTTLPQVGSEKSSSGAGLPAKKAKQEQVLAAVKRLHGTASVDPKQPDKGVISIDLHGTKASDADLVLLEGLTGLCTLNLYGTRITDAGLTYVGGLTGLQTLHLNSTAITDGGLEKLRPLVHLKELSLRHTRITDAGLLHLAGMNELHSLTLSSNQITDAGLKYLKSLRGLKQLFLMHTQVTSAGVDELHEAIPNLKIFP
jgi:hypothetical protein